MTFASSNDAKRFFVTKIVDEAERQNTPLSEIERRMLFWSEVYPSPDLPKEEIAGLQEQFAAKYDDQEYESRIAGLIRQAHDQAVQRSENLDEWREAYRLLSKEDHYILVMIQQALGGKLGKKKFLGIF